MAGVFGGIHMINVYAPSGAAKKAERETFFQKELIPLLPKKRTEIVLAGDFNCTMNKTDTTGQVNPSKAFEILIQGLNLHDTGLVRTQQQRFTHFTPKGAARIDRIYESSQLKGQQQGIDTIPAAFTDHMAVILRIATEDTRILKGRGYWRMNTRIIRDKTSQKNLANKWKEWGKHQRFYPNKVVWWTRYVKPMLKRYFQREGAECRRERRTLENFYYEAIYDALEKTMETVRKAVLLKKLKAQITNLHYKEGLNIAVNLEEDELMRGEELSLYTYIRAKKQTQNTILQIQDADGRTHKTMRDIMRVGTTFIREKYKMIEVDTATVTEIMDNVQTKLNSEEKEAMDAPVTMVELETAVKMGKNKQSARQ